MDYASCILGAPAGKTEEAVVALAVEVRRLDAMRCETCRWCAKDWPCTLTDICAKVSIPGHSVAVVACSQLGGGCLAWEKRDEA